MNINQLRTVLAIAETGSLTRAAELLHVVQPALSRQLRLLEEELGAAIFERTPRGMTLTVPGKRFLDQVRVSLQGLDQAKAEVLSGTSGLQGTVSVGMLPSFATVVAAPLITSLREKYSDLKVRLVAGFTGDLQGQLERGELDVGLLGDYGPSTLLATTPVLQEPLYVVSLPDSGLKDDEPLALNKVADLPLILPASPQGLRQLIDRACTIIGINLNVVAEANDTAIQLELVQRGVGYAILPLIAISTALEAGLVAVAPITSPTLHRTVVIGSSIVKRDAATTSTLHKQLLMQLQEYLPPFKSMGLKWLLHKSPH